MQNISFMVQNTPVGRTRVSESKEVMESICNHSRSSDDWQYMGIDCLLLLLHVRYDLRISHSLTFVLLHVCNWSFGNIVRLFYQKYQMNSPKGRDFKF